MAEKLPTVMEVLLKAFIESKGETVDLVIEHPELPGLTLEMLQWWGVNRNDSSYRMWCPEDHISFEWEVPPSKGQRAGAIEHAEEKISEFPASVLRIRHGEERGSILGPGDEPIAWILHERQETPNGIKMRSTFTFPAKTPQRFLDAMRKHCLAEMGHLPEFLPSLYRLNVGKL